MTLETLDSMAAARAFIDSIAADLDPDSRYISDLRSIVSSCGTVAELETRLTSASRGRRHAGAQAFEAMSLADKLRCNLVTAETSLFRFAEGELEASRAVIEAANGRPLRVLIVPCSHGEEAFTMAAFLLAEACEFSIRAFDIQVALLEEARRGRLTFGYPERYLASAGYVGADVLARIEFVVGDAFNLPIADDERFDLVLCRNFIGYFVAERAGTLTTALARRVAPGGRLFLDSFCLGKTPAVLTALAAQGMTRVDSHPVFARPTSV